MAFGQNEVTETGFNISPKTMKRPKTKYGVIIFKKLKNNTTDHNEPLEEGGKMRWALQLYQLSAIERFRAQCKEEEARQSPEVYKDEYGNLGRPKKIEYTGQNSG